jgi:hypothetical protein
LEHVVETDSDSSDGSSDSDTDRDSPGQEERSFPLECTKNFRKFLDKLSIRLCSNAAITEKQALVDLFMDYHRQNRYLFCGNPEFEKDWKTADQGGEDNELLDQAWAACESANLELFEAVLKKTRKLWMAVHNDALKRLDSMDERFQEEKLNVALEMGASRFADTK